MSEVMTIRIDRIKVNRAGPLNQDFELVPGDLNLIYGHNETGKTYIVETAGEIQSSWLQGQGHIGITAGASTDERTINEVLAKLESMAGIQS